MEQRPKGAPGYAGGGRLFHLHALLLRAPGTRIRHLRQRLWQLQRHEATGWQWCRGTQAEGAVNASWWRLPHTRQVMLARRTTVDTHVVQHGTHMIVQYRQDGTVGVLGGT